MYFYYFLILYFVYYAPMLLSHKSELFLLKTFSKSIIFKGTIMFESKTWKNIFEASSICINFLLLKLCT